MNKLILVGLLGLLFAGSVQARPRKESSVSFVARNDGDSYIPFAITVSSHLWTVVGSSQTYVVDAIGNSRLRRRSLTIQTLGTVTYSVCISSVSGASDACSDSMAGYELGSAWGAVSIFDESVWYARTRAGGTTVIKGAEHFDSRDETVKK